MATALQSARRAGRLGRAAMGRVRGVVYRSAPESRTEVVEVDLVEARARAERAELEVERLQRELAAKDEILREARKALLTARMALREQLRRRE